MNFDGHCDIFTDVTIRRLQGERQILKTYHLDRLRKGDFAGGCFVFWIDPPYTENPANRLKQLLTCAREELNECEDVVAVRSPSEIEKAKEDGKFYILLGMEGLSGLGSDPDFLYSLYDDHHVRHTMLTWNEQNAFATGVKGDASRGLTDLGKRAISIIQEKKMILDISHLNEKSFWDVVNYSTTPLVASHSNARALASTPRNLTDDQLFVIRDTEGLVGLNSFNQFVHDDIKEQTIDSFIRHATYIAEKIGVEYLAFGFDFCEFLFDQSMAGFSNKREPFLTGLEDCTKTPVFLKEMRKAGFTEKELQLVAEENWLRIIQTVSG